MNDMSSEIIKFLSEIGFIGVFFTAIIIVFTLIASIVHRNIYRNLLHLKRDVEDLHDRFNVPNQSGLLTDLVNSFKLRNIKESRNIESFVQSFFSTYRRGKSFLKLPIINEIKMVQSMISILILLGVLGTFIGLTISLGSLDIPSPNQAVEQTDGSQGEAGTADGNSLVAKISDVLSGINVAFYTSIAGMIGSLLLTIYTRYRNAEHLLTEIMLQVENYLDDLNTDASKEEIKSVMVNIYHAILSLDKNNQASMDTLQNSNKKSFDQLYQGIIGVKGEVIGVREGVREVKNSLGALEDFSAGFNQAAASLEKFNDGLQENVNQFTQLFQDMKILTDGFGSGVDELNRNFAGLFTFFKESEERNEQFIQGYNETFQRFKSSLDIQERNQEKLSSSMDAHVEKMGAIEYNMQHYLEISNKEMMTLAGEMRVFISEHREHQASLKESFENLQQHHERFNQGIDEKISKMELIFGEEFKQMIHQFGDHFQGQMSLLTNNLQELTHKFLNYGAVLDELSSDVLKLIHSQSGYQKHLDEEKNMLEIVNQKFDQSIEQFTATLNAHHTYVSEIRDIHSQSATSYQSMEEQNHKLIEEIRNSTQLMKTAFDKRDNHIKHNIDYLQESLNRSVKIFEDNLTKSLSSILQDLGKYVQITNKIIGKQMEEMGLVSETYQEGISQHLSQMMISLTEEMKKVSLSVEQFSQAAHQLTSMPENKGRNIV
jgi:hypothetical protein